MIFITVRQHFPIQNNANIGYNAFIGTVIGGTLCLPSAAKKSNRRLVHLTAGHFGEKVSSSCQTFHVLIKIATKGENNILSSFIILSVSLYKVTL